jgi:hypothetical protein
MTKSFSQITESIRPNLPDINSDFFNYIKDIKFKHGEIKIEDLSFEYGEYIFNQGKFQKKQKCDDNYFSFSIVLERGFETFLEGENFTPLHISLPGDIVLIDEACGIKQTFPQENLDMTAGARSIFISAKIGDILSYMRVAKEYQLEQDVPKKPTREWAMFRELAHKAKCPWRARLLLISVEKSVFQSERCDRLRHALRNSMSPYHALLENRLRFEFDMKKFMTEAEFKTHPSTMEHIKQLYFISRGQQPGFSFASDDMLAPVDLFKEVLIKIYGLPYTPSIAQPGHPESDRPCYYPLQNTVQLTPKRSHTSGLEELDEVEKTLTNFDLFMVKTKRHVKNTISANSSIDFFHHQPGAKANIRTNREIPRYDPTIQTDVKATDLPFCETSPVFRGGLVAIKTNTKARYGS